VRYKADRFLVVLDANVLFPFRKRDVILRFAQAGLFRARWTDDIIAEWTGSLLARKPQLATSIGEQESAMRTAFPEAWVTGYRELIADIRLPDPNDRHVLAAAIRCGAQHIITDNLRDFPERALEAFDIEAIGADEFLARTFDLYPAQAIEALRTMRQSYANPPMTPAEFVMDLIAKGLPKVAARLLNDKHLL
jgi:hypothetical protein